MNYDQTTRLSVDCPACSFTNRLTFTRVADHETVSCSRCGSEIGHVGALVASSKQTVEEHLASEVGGSPT
jgi:hypothetical protein